MSDTPQPSSEETDGQRPVLPTKTIDEDASLAERLTDNVRNRIGAARYFKRDEDGNPIEDWGDVFGRVAGNVAIATAVFHDVPVSVSRSELADWVAEDTVAELFGDSEYRDLDEDVAPYVDYEALADRLEPAPGELTDAYQSDRADFEQAMREQRFMPNSPTLMNAGAELQQLSACIAGDAPVYTNDGLKPMADVSVGDKVLTHTGSFKEVTAHWSNGIKSTVDIDVGGAHQNELDVSTTPDHEFYSQDETWVRADELEDPAHPTPDPDVEFPEVLHLDQHTHVMKKDKPVVLDGGKLKVKNGDDERTAEYDQQYNQPTGIIDNNDDFAFLLGAFLADGDVDGSDVRFTVGADDDVYKEKIISVATDAFDLPVAVSTSNHGEWETLSISSPFVAELVLSLVGSGVDEKKVPSWAFGAPETYREQLLDGLLTGDGTNKGEGTRLQLANPTLAYEAYLLARSVGKNAKFDLHDENELSTRPTSRCYITSADNHQMDNVVRRSGDNVEVFDMEVAGDHSFAVGDFIVHNCFVREPGDAMVGDADDGRTSIMGAAADAADIFRSGGGIGYPFHLLRPKGALVSSTGGISSGPMSFMQIYDTVCGTVKQGGKRRGAQMGIMHVEHPDIGRFCVAKRGEDNLTNFNISAGLTDEFLEAVEDDEQYTLVDPQTGWPNPEPFEVVPETAHFYDPEFADAWNDEYDKPGLGLDGKQVEANFWRDHLENMQDPEAFEQYRDQIDLEVGEPMTLPAGFIYQLIVDGAHNNGEPGFVYLDEANREHSFDVAKHPDHFIHSSNPCAEQMLEDAEACNLGHVNLSLMVDEDAQSFDEWNQGNLPDFKNFLADEHIDEYLEHALDTDLLDDTVETGTRFLENVVTMSKFPLEEIETQVHNKRKIGLGLMGFHQMLLQMGVEYGSRTSLKIAERVMKRLDRVATETSHQLADERGVFPEYSESKWSNPTGNPEWFSKHAHLEADKHAGGYEMRNHNVTTIAPTGTTSMIGDTTGGCEPIYNVAFFKNVGDDIQGDEMLVEFDDYFLKTLEANGISPSAVREEATEKMLNNEFDSVEDLDTVPDAIGELFVTTEDLTVDEHINVQAAFQRYCDSSISKTLNMANDISIDAVGDAIRDACRKGIKGATVYRVGSRQEEVKTTSVTGGGVTVSESDTDELVDELLERLADEDLDEERRTELMGSLGLADTSVTVQNDPVAVDTQTQDD